MENPLRLTHNFHVAYELKVKSSFPVSTFKEVHWSPLFPSIATKGNFSSNDSNKVASVATTMVESKPAATETALLQILEKILWLFGIVLNLPPVNSSLQETLRCAKKQPGCPQLCIYSSADTVFPSEYVESFIEE